jgi:hypothetical protein
MYKAAMELAYDENASGHPRIKTGLANHLGENGAG